MIFWVVAAFVAWALIRTPSAEEQEMSKDRLVIETCWSDYNRKSLSIFEKPAMAGVCEKFEADFRAKYHREP